MSQEIYFLADKGLDARYELWEVIWALASCDRYLEGDVRVSQEGNTEDLRVLMGVEAMLWMNLKNLLGDVLWLRKLLNVMKLGSETLLVSN
ncbi:hypothetical protein QUB80_15210 [Chlorogloeopsis sp. ULAP01]|uniref:hypothetical protein n=1 Tax=Chlorogloeopsis sp. ULAP01 TaxID=3056483 RepID=UPI0025AA720E|nr:hypothetical protein [Chlorogloeopsis sp. ULAP01]MDM9382050.1 hypothetical protein [Chlorogloeopsis sp. ULAP01]